MESREVATLYFGRNIGGALGVSETDFARFVAQELTPRFPDGLTVSDANGQWRDTETGALVREPVKLVTLILSTDQARDRAAIAEIVAAYRSEFRQQAVAQVRERSCVGF